MNLNTIQEHLIKDVTKLDGKTYGSHNRYIVAITDNKIKNVTTQQLETLFNKFSIIIESLNINSKSFSIGFWKDSGYTYIDLSISLNDKSQAVIIGKLFNQLAIWDSETNKEIGVLKCLV